MIHLKIEGMSCGHCALVVGKALQDVPGVTSVSRIHHKRGEAQVEGDATPEALIETVRAQGYEATVLGP